MSRNHRFEYVTGAISSYFSNLNVPLLVISILLSVVGIFAVSTATSGSSRYLLVQLIACGLGLAVVFVLSKIDYDFIGTFSTSIQLISFVVLLFTALFAETISGNANWIQIGSVSIQPSEFAKVAFILTFSVHLSKEKENLNRLKTLALLVLHFFVYFLPILLQGDFGSAIIFFGIFAVMMLMAGVKLRYFALGGVAIAAAVPFVWAYVLQDYHKQRILFSLNPDLDPQHYGYQPIISRIAIGSGRLFGMGYGKGIQTQNALLPARHTDFIFSVIGEEFGLVGCLLVLGLFVALLMCLIRAANNARNESGYLICFGLAAMFGVQFLINVGMCTGVSPVIGVTLPFISAGGSSVLSSFFAIGLAESVCMKPDFSLHFGGRKKYSLR